jgi:hypothetical protein
MKHLLTAIACFFALSMSAQNMDPSQYCGTGTIWSESSQMCVAQPAALQAYDGNLDGCVNVTDLLGLLSIFGVCEPDGQTIYWFSQFGNSWPNPLGGDYLDTTAQFFIQDCSIDTGYYLTTDLNVVLDFVFESGPGDSLLWCDDILYGYVTPIDSLENVSNISQNEIPNFTLVSEVNDGILYLAIPQSFAENELLLQTPFFENNILSLTSNFIFPERRECVIHGIDYWLYGKMSYGGFNVLCGY